MVNYSTNEMVSSSELVKKFGKYLLQIKNNDVDKLAVLKNNKIEAIIISPNEYEVMKAMSKKLEAEKISHSINMGIKDIKEGKTHSIDKLWDEF